MGGAGRVAESWQHCVEIWVERDAGCSGLRGPSCRAISHVACAPAVAPSVATCGGVWYGRGRAPTQRPVCGMEGGEGLLHVPSWCGADASSEATRSGGHETMLIPRFELTLHARPAAACSLLRPVAMLLAEFLSLAVCPPAPRIEHGTRKCAGTRRHNRNCENDSTSRSTRDRERLLLS